MLISLSGELCRPRAAELKRQLLDAQAGDTRLEIDLSAVTELDCAGLQILMLLKREAQRSERELRLHSHSPAVLDVFERLNVAAFFGDALIEPDPAHGA